VIGAQGRVLRNDAAEAIMIYGINWDRTKEVELEKNLQLERAKSLHQSKLATIGQLAAGVGHEINNPLAIISGQIVLAQQMLKDLGISQDHILERFRKIDNSVSRIANIVKGLRTFARSDDEQITIFNVHEPILETFDLFKDMYQKEGVVLKINNSAPAAYLTGNRGRFQQVLINLISNAKDASEGKQDRHIEIHTSIEKEVLVLKIKDNGCGVEPELQEKIFEPFFTTKETSKGTGIGLSLVSTIIKELRGKVELESRIGEGSVFSVTLPVQLTIKQMVPPSSVTLSKLEQLPLRVLIVDDEEDLRDILASTLSRICTSVESVESAELALKVMENKPIDVIISDIKMPKMDGFEFLRTLRERKDLQQPRFIFISGGVDMTRDQEQIMTTETDGFIPKPFRIEQIQEHLKTLVMKS
jgi:nitrogen-specific signal transduction histidine kinase/ActR/RegA family two-component response regulator